MRLNILFLFLVLPALAQTNELASTNHSSTIPNQTNQTPAVGVIIRLNCIQHRRVICGKVLKVLPDGLVVDSGYTNLMRPPLNFSWVVRGSVKSERATNLVEGNRPESVCLGLVFLTDLPKRPVPKVYDYVNLVGFPTGSYTYTSVGELRRTVRRFSTKIAKAVQWRLDEAGQQSAPLK